MLWLVFSVHPTILARARYQYNVILTNMRPLHYEAISKMLLERFGEPIGDNQAPPTSGKKKDMGNRGFGSDDLGEGCCDQCGEMPMEMDQDHACSEGGLDQKAPPGGEKVVKALKRDKKVKNPWAVAWAMKNRGEI